MTARVTRLSETIDCSSERVTEEKVWPKAKAGRSEWVAEEKGWQKTKAGQREGLAEDKG